MAEDAGLPKKAPKGRSPSYPGVDLGVALQRAERLFESQRDHASTIPVVLGRWGYKATSGAGLVTLAALKKFGLLEDEGTGKARQAKLSPLALRIVRDRRPDSSERQQAIRQAALSPKIHREVWDRWHGQLPDDEDVIFYLEQERGFTSHGAKEFIEQFRRTISFAQLSPSDSLEDNDGDTGGEKKSGGDGEGSMKLLDPPADPALETVRVPVTGAKWPILQLPKPMTKQAWQQMLRYLELMEPAFTETDTPEETGD